MVEFRQIWSHWSRRESLIVCTGNEDENSIDSIQRGDKETDLVEGGSPGLVFMGGDSSSKGRGFESQRRILDGHFFSVVKMVLFV